MKYAGAGLVAIAISGTYYLAKHVDILNRPPMADFEYEPRYINPTSEDTIKFLNKSKDPDNEDTLDNIVKRYLDLNGPQELRYSWYVDHNLVSSSRDYSTCMPATSIGTEHRVKLSVSDGRKESYVKKAVEVDPNQLYPEKLRMWKR